MLVVPVAPVVPPVVVPPVVVPPVVLLAATHGVALLVRTRTVGATYWCALALTVALACCAFVMALLCSVARLRSRSCGVVDCKQRSFTRVCATPLTMDAIWQ